MKKCKKSQIIIKNIEITDFDAYSTGAQFRAQMDSFVFRRGQKEDSVSCNPSRQFSRTPSRSSKRLSMSEAAKAEKTSLTNKEK